MSRSLLFPLQIDGSGGFAYTEDPGRVVQQSLEIAVGTQQGERVMRSDYGSKALEYVLDNDALGAELLETDISNTITRNVPEVSLIGVDVTSDGLSTTSINLRYMLDNGQQESLDIAFPETEQQ